MGLLDGQRAFITGGASGIGRATARMIAAEGARVAVADINGEGAKEVAGEIDGLAFELDVTDLDGFQSAVREAASAFGGLTVAFNNAGAGLLANVHEYTGEQWDQVVRLNLGGVFNGMKAEVPIILESGGGSIVNTASISGVRPSAGESPYAAAKAGVVALTQSGALEYAPAIRVNAVSPGWILTGLTAPWKEIPGEEARAIERTPMKRLGQPEDIAKVVAFLCSDLAGFITGQNIVVDGGMILHGAGVDGMLAYLQSAIRGDPPAYY